MNRRDQVGIAADKYIISNDTRGLILPVVVTGHRSAPKIDIPSNLRIPNIG